jgi:hypothetical protein
MTTFGDQLYQYGGAPVNIPLTTGQVWWINKSTGQDASDRGKRPDKSLSTWSQAHSNATADQQDTVVHVATDNSASGTTDYLSISRVTTASCRALQSSMVWMTRPLEPLLFV